MATVVPVAFDRGGHALTGGAPLIERLPIRTLIVCVALVGGLVIPRLAVLPTGPRDLTFLLVTFAIALIGCFSFSFSVTSTVAVFVFSALVRRLIPAADIGADVTAIAPFVVAIPLAVRALRKPKPASVVVFLGWATVAAGLALRSSPPNAVAAWMNLVVPLLAAMAIVNTPRGLELLATATVFCGGLAATYGIAQFYSPTSWDLNWLNRSNFAKYGTPRFRPFSTLPAPRTAAVLCAIVILILVFRPALVRLARPIQVWALVASTIFILPAQIRNVWLSLAISALIGILITRSQRTRKLIVPGVVIAVVIVASPMGAVVAKRFGTLTNLGGDTSYQNRLDLVRQVGAFLSPVGSGLGFLSSGKRAEQSAVENGYIVVLGETGLFGVVLLGWVLVSRGRRLEPTDVPFFVFLVVANMGGYLFSGFGGFLLWSLCGLGRAPPEETETADTAEAPVGAVS